MEHGHDPDPAKPLVVVDRHALSVAAGDRATVFDYAFSRLGTKGQYNKVAQTYIDAARKISEQEGHPVAPHQVQAVTWLVRQRKNQQEDMLRSENRASNAASNAKTLWKDWEEFAKVNFPELLEHEAQTGYNSTLPEDVEHQIALTVEANAVQSIDLAVGDALGVIEPPTQTVQVQTPPSQSEVVQHIVEILLAAYAIDKTAHAIADLIPGVPWKIVKTAIKLSGGMHGHRAHARLNGMDPESVGGKAARSGARQEVFYRASYILNAATRLAETVRDGKPLSEAVDEEGLLFKQHEKARQGRLDAAKRTADAANLWGNLLGWYINPNINNETECLAANEHNFYADQGTVIGYPGSVHLGCGCEAGPPHHNATLVNEAIAAAREVVFIEPRRYGLAPGKARK